MHPSNMALCRALLPSLPSQVWVPSALPDKCPARSSPSPRLPTISAGGSTFLGGLAHQWPGPAIIRFFQQAAALTALSVPHIIQPGGQHQSGSPPFSFLSSGTLDMLVHLGEPWPSPPSNGHSNPYCAQVLSVLKLFLRCPVCNMGSAFKPSGCSIFSLPISQVIYTNAQVSSYFKLSNLKQVT